MADGEGLSRGAEARASSDALRRSSGAIRNDRKEARGNAK